MVNNQKGKFVVLYGANNLGKTTQAKMLVENLIIKFGKNAEYLKYAVYNLEPSGPLINDYLRGGNHFTFSGREFQMLQVLNRTQYETKLQEKLNKGTWIVAEDYTGTGIAWGMANGIDKNLLYELNSHLLKEDLGILFEGTSFVENLEKTNAHETNLQLLQKVNTAFKEISRDFNWQTINANQSIEEIQNQILEIVKNKILTAE